MNFMNRVISRIEKGNPIVLGFNYDDETPEGTKANVTGLTRYKDKWLVTFEDHRYLGSGDNMTLLEYMEKTKDMK